MDMSSLRAVEADDWQAREDLTDTIPDSFDHEVVASLPVLPEGSDEPQSVEKFPDWSGALQLIGDASGVLRQRDVELESLRAQIEMQKAAAADEMRALNAQLKQAREETQRAHEEASYAKKRALKAEAWLQQINEALATGFAPHFIKTRK